MEAAIWSEDAAISVLKRISGVPEYQVRRSTERDRDMHDTVTRIGNTRIGLSGNYESS